MGRQILPDKQPFDVDIEVTEEPYDVYAISSTRCSEPQLYFVDGEFIEEEHVESDMWRISVHDAQGETVERFEMDKSLDSVGDEEYTHLRDSVEQHLGRSGLLILVC